MLSKEQFYAKHASSPKWVALSKEQKKQRYQDYLSSSPKAVAFRQSSSKKKVPAGSPSGGKARGKGFALNSGYKMNPKTHDYLTARYNPFCPRLADVGYPVGAPGGTIKVRAYARGTMVCNAAGYGSIMMSVGGAAGGLPAVQFSSNAVTYVQATDAFPNISAAGTTSTALQGCPITQVGATATQYLRIIGCGIRIRNTTAILNKGGSCKSICYPVPATDMSGLTGDQVLTQFRRYSGWYDLSSAESPWMSAVWQPTLPFEAATATGATNLVQCEGGMFNLNNVNSINNAYNLGIIIAASATATFDWEVVEFYEIIGTPTASGGSGTGLLNTLITPSTPDPIGASIAQVANQTTLVNAMPKAADGGISVDSILQSIGSAARSVLGSSSPADMLSSVMGSISTPASASLDLPSPGESLQGWASDSSSGLLADLESRFFSLTGREAGTALEGVGEALAMAL